jgi:hypothetical protein
MTKLKWLRRIELAVWCWSRMMWIYLAAVPQCSSIKEIRKQLKAVRRARSVQFGPAVPPIRRGHHYIDLARGYAMAEDYAGSLRCLQEARRIAPQQTRHHPMVRETVLSIAAARRGREELSLFASWLGVG